MPSYTNEFRQQMIQDPRSAAALQRVYGVPNATISVWRRSAGLATTSGRRSTISDEDKSKIVHDPRSTHEMAAATGYSAVTIFLWRRAAGVSRPKEPRKPKPPKQPKTRRMVTASPEPKTYKPSGFRLRPPKGPYAGMPGRSSKTRGTVKQEMLSLDPLETVD